MARELMLLVATVIVCVAPGIHGTLHMTFAADKEVGEITREGCGDSKVCVETPAGCDPADAGCLFTSVVHNTSTSPPTLSIALCGESSGYVGMGLTKDLEDTEPFTVFLCAVNHQLRIIRDGSFFLRTQMKDSEGNLSAEEVVAETRVREIRFNIEGDKIKCQFNIPETEENMHVILGHGTTEGNVFGNFITEVESGLKTVMSSA